MIKAAICLLWLAGAIWCAAIAGELLMAYVLASVVLAAFSLLIMGTIRWIGSKPG
jgi:hypothetical protein